MYPKNTNLVPNYFYLAISLTEVPNYHYERHYKFLQDKLIIIPDELVLQSFHKNTIPIFDEILNFQKQNHLINLRFLLRPLYLVRFTAEFLKTRLKVSSVISFHSTSEKFNKPLVLLNKFS